MAERRTSFRTRKRPSPSTSSSVDVSVKKAKHRLGYDSCWQTDYPWHIPVYDNDDDDDDEKTVIGVLCALCKHYSVKQRNKSGTWTEKPCTLLRKDLLQRHKTS